MSISNSQYEEIMRGYNARQLHNRKITEERRKEVYRRSPRLKEIDDAIASSSVSSVRLMFSGNSNAKEELNRILDALRREKASILSGLDLPADYLAPVYDCPDCKDTGYIGNRKCHCLRQAIIDTVYSQSHIRSILDRENFDHFSYKYYSDTAINKATGLSSLETMKQAVAVSRHFIEDFNHKPKNLLFYGSTGVGKTFLSNCIAKELLDRGYSVVYFSAFQMFDILSRGVFEKDSDAIAAHQNIFDCDLLIIDDLGTEMTNTFTVSQLFLCVNERIIRQKSTIISTNLGIHQLMETYSERTFSRITSSYTICKLFGDDIRLKK